MNTIITNHNGNKMKTPAEMYKAYTDGDPLTDQELEVGIEHFSQLAHLAGQAGSVFRLAANEAQRVVLMLSSFKEFRARP